MHDISYNIKVDLLKNILVTENGLWKRKNSPVNFMIFQGFSVHDGPGIRLTLFLKGCPLRCPWCHSPESQEFYTELNWMEMKCVGVDKCGNCLNVCPHDAIFSR